MTPAVPLYRYQKAWLLDQARFKIGMFARQTGKPFTTTLEIVDDCFQAEAAGGRARWVILSRGERQAKEAMDEGIKRHAKAYALAIEESEYEFRPDDNDKVAYKALEVTLPGGSRITALPANPDTARGFSANVFLDEFAFHADSRAIWAALFPVISKKGLRLRITSTPNGRGNKFYDLMTAEDATWSRHVVDIHAAVADGLERDIAELKAGLNDDEIWKQEFELEWADGAGALLDWSLIDGADSNEAGDPAGYQGGLCYIGNDIAARRDRWVAAVFELVGDVLVLRELVVRRKITFAEQDAIIAGMMERYRVAGLWMDQTGMGEKPVQDMVRLYGSHRVQGWLLTGPAKLYLATEAKKRFEDRRVRLGSTAEVSLNEIRNDLFKVKRVEDAQGQTRLVAERDATGHADIAWAVFLALAAADGEAIAYDGHVSGGTRRKDAGVFSGGGSSGGRMKMLPDEDDGPRNAEGAW